MTCDVCGEVYPGRAMAFRPSGQWVCVTCLWGAVGN